MLKIYGADLSTPANKVRMMVNALDIPYEYVRVSIRDQENRTPEFLQMNPNGKIPVLDDNGFILFESGAICRYLADKQNSSLYPKDLKQRALVDQWTDFAVIHINGAMNRVVFNRIFAKRIGRKIDEQSLRDGLAFLEKFLPVVDDRLEGRDFLAEDGLTLADISLISILDPCEVAEVDLSAYKNIVAWRNRLRQEPFYKKCHDEYGEPLKKFMTKKT
ncbi:MAG: glutathione S-transferase family protein [Candidatus Omnitrophica bacterium]|nr:glutathione S-transferase family protein [Candidatus Omnitrophota bacterium]